MSEKYRRLAVFVDRPSEESFLWLLLESTDDPAVWLDLEAGKDTYSTWMEAHQAGNKALPAYVDDEKLGPLADAVFEDGEPEEE